MVRHKLPVVKEEKQEEILWKIRTFKSTYAYRGIYKDVFMPRTRHLPRKALIGTLTDTLSCRLCSLQAQRTSALTQSANKQRHLVLLFSFYMFVCLFLQFLASKENCQNMSLRNRDFIDTQTKKKYSLYKNSQKRSLNLQYSIAANLGEEKIITTLH